MSARAIDADTVLAALSRHIGEDKGVSAGALVTEITGELALTDQTRRLRKTIHELRMQGYHVCGHPSCGYFMARTEAELNRTCLFLHHRAISSLAQAAAMKNVSLPDLKGQLHLPD